MKKLILLCVVVSLYSCVKVQKKSEMDQQPDSTVQVNKEPVIFVLDEVMTLTEDTEIVADEVHLKSNARIYNKQFALKIQATSIYIDRGVFIKTFVDEQLVAPIGTPALDGGVVHIVANDIHGNLQVFMNGQQGGEGFPGWRAHPMSGVVSSSEPEFNACLPNSGADSGISGSFFLEVNQSKEFSITTSMRVAIGGLIGQLIANPFGSNANPNYLKSTITCNVSPKVGKPGIPGQICVKLSATDLARCEKF